LALAQNAQINISIFEVNQLGPSLSLSNKTFFSPFCFNGFAGLKFSQQK
jgi:hypothetical protein